MSSRIKGEPVEHTILRFLLEESLQANNESQTPRDKGTVLRCLAKRVATDAGGSVSIDDVFLACERILR